MSDAAISSLSHRAATETMSASAPCANASNWREAPAASVRRALALLDAHAVAGAILDVNLLDRDTAPVVERLLERNVPLVLQSGIGLSKELEAKFPNLSVRIKPVSASELVAELEARLAG